MSDSTPKDHPSAIRASFIFAFSAIAALGACNLEWILPSLSVIAASILLLATPWMYRSRSFGWQVVARATWWQATLVGSLFLWATSGSSGVMLALGGLGAAVVGGLTGLSNPGGAFAPSVYRRTLTASLILGIADLIVLCVYAGRSIEMAISWGPESASELLMPTMLLVGAAAAMSIAVFGLLRLRMWGLVACISANLAVAALAITGAFGLQDFLSVGLAATAVAQLLLPIPLVARIVRTQRLAP